MPELNLDNLKTKRVTSKKRPWDLEIPVPQKSSKTPEENKESEENFQPLTEDKIFKNENSVFNEESIRQKIEAELKLEYDKKIAEIKRSEPREPAEPYEDDHFKSLEPSLKESTSIKSFSKPILGKELLEILNKMFLLSAPARELYKYLLIETDLGKLENVQIGRRKIEADVSGISRSFKDSIKQLEENNLIRVEEGYIKPTRKKGTFYTLV